MKSKTILGADGATKMSCAYWLATDIRRNLQPMKKPD